MTISLYGTGSVEFESPLRNIVQSNGISSYEEGNWTGYLRMSSSTAVTNENTGWNTTFPATGTFIKFGRTCQISIYFDVTGFSNFTALRVDGLPYFARPQAEAFPGAGGYPINIGHCRGMRFNYNGTILSSANLTAAVYGGSNSISLQAGSRASAFSGWWYISNEPAQGKYIHLAGTYQTAF